MLTAVSEQCFSTLKKLKHFERNAMNEDCLNSLAMISVNKDLIHIINHFDRKVIENFILQKNSQLDFVYPPYRLRYVP